MAFTTNYENTGSGFELIPEGVYEVVITNIEERTTRRGATGLNLSLCIRNDVEQKYRNRYIFHTCWKREQPEAADMQMQGYSFKQIMRLAKAAQLPSGKAYENMEELCRDLLRKPLKVTVIHDVYNGNTREQVQYVDPTEFPEMHHKFKDKSADRSRQTRPAQNTSIGASADVPEGFEEIVSADDIPF